MKMKTEGFVLLALQANIQQRFSRIRSCLMKKNYYVKKNIATNQCTLENLQSFLSRKIRRPAIYDGALAVNKVLQPIFEDVNVTLIDFKLEFGRDMDGNVLLADEISPDTCRLWDATTKQKLDKDVFRRDLGNLTEVYTIILSRLGGK